jgi:nucleoside-diphosphate-sugar epimerase
MRIAVTGSLGFVGTHVMRDLMANGHEAIGVDIRRPEPDRAEFPEFRWADLNDAGSLEKAFAGCEAIIHLAAVPDPGIVSPEELFRTNVVGTFNALEAAVAVGARRFVAASSEAALGFSFRQVDMAPEYFPIDENHPLRPQDEYSLGKVLIEEMCRSYTRRGSLSTVSLRTCYVWDTTQSPSPAQFTDPAKAHNMLWLYVHVSDAARAYRLACENNDIENETLFIAAQDGFTPFPVRDLVERFYPDIPITAELGTYGSLISGARAREVLGFEATASWRDPASADEAASGQPG